ncbi:MAG: ABC transporter ATP-binding protein [Nitrospinota bacterium]|nr:MAG: ABC transporter ATP-binding protein [Nitrospinota bacterium]
MAELLRAEGLVKRFDHFVAVNGVSLSFDAGVLTSIIGPNGAGKTTLINLLSGNLPCDAGRILFQGEEITHLPPHERVGKGISRSFQITTIFPQMTVFQNVQLPVLARLGRAGHPFARPDLDPEVRAEVEMLLREIGLEEIKGVRAGNLSHGDQRLLEIGMAIASRPRLCFLDEPCSGMNPAERGQVQDLIRRLAREWEVTFVIVEHDMDVVFTLSDHIIVMHQGAILTQGKPEEIREHAGVREIYLGEEIGT